ncbi:MAG: AAC(3) family N-acetyltransferase [Magnetospirillum sp.]
MAAYDPWVRDAAQRLAAAFFPRPADIVWLSVDLALTLRAARVPAASAEDFAADVLAAMRAALGEQATILVSTFHFGFPAAKRYQTETAAAQTGAFGALLLKRHAAARTIHPFYNFLAFGPRAAEIRDRLFPNSFGDESIFAWLADNHAHLVSVGHHYVKALTGTHHAEDQAGVTYRYRKSFSGEVVRGDTVIPANVSFYVRQVDICDHSSLTRAGDDYFRAHGMVDSLKLGSDARAVLAHHLDLGAAHRVMVDNLRHGQPKFVDYYGPGRDNSDVGVITADIANRLYLDELKALP